MRQPSASSTGSASRRIAFFTFGKGSGDVVVGLALAEAFRRARLDIDFTIISDNEYPWICNGIAHFRRVPTQPHMLFISDERTHLYRAISDLRPDLLIVYGSWVPVLPYIRDLHIPRVLLLRQCNDPWLSLPLPGGKTVPINPGDYDLALSCEPGFQVPGFAPINPIVIRNRDEILSRPDARARLGVPDGKRLCVIARNGYLGELDVLLARHSDSYDSSDWHVHVTTNADGEGIFPLVDYAEAIDLLVSGGGYATFYETRYFGISSVLESFPRHAEDIDWRLRTNADYTFDVNGADQFVERTRPLLE